jgi:hypothetical protein
MSKEEFSPRRSLAERYSIEGMAKYRGMSVEEFKVSIDEEIKIKNDLIQKYLDKGYSQEQAETTAMRIMYIPGFSGPTFNNETIKSYERRRSKRRAN